MSNQPSAQFADLQSAFRQERDLTPRQRRALRTRAKALSPVRILLKLVMAPFVAFGMMVSIYVATSPFEREDAMKHLAAMLDCDVAMSVGVPFARAGSPGYHARHDLDGNGVACDDGTFAAADEATQGGSPEISGARFIKP